MIDETIPGYRLPNEQVDLVKLFGASEGEICLLYGHIRQGKTYGGTHLGIQAADTGLPVYFNYPVQYNGYDERTNLLWVLVSLIWPWKDRFYKFNKSLVKYFEISDEWAQREGYKDFWHWFKTRTDCLIIADEGHVLLDSYKKTYMSMETRQAVLETGHFSRRLMIISQRPTAVHVSARGNVNIFYKYERIMRWPILWFKRTEFQDMAMETVDETKPLSTKWIFGSRRVMKAFNSKYLRKGMKASQNIDVDIFDFFYWEKWKLFTYVLDAYWKTLTEAGQGSSDEIKKIWAMVVRPFKKIRPSQTSVATGESSAPQATVTTGVAAPATDKLLRTGYMGPVLRKKEVAAVQLGTSGMRSDVREKDAKEGGSLNPSTPPDRVKTLF